MKKRQQSMLKIFEDFHAGQVITLGPRLIAREEIIEFANQFDPQPFHLDQDDARASLLGGLAASGWHTCSVLIRMICDAVLSNSAVLGSRGMDEVKWLNPVHAGDVLSGAMTILTARSSNSRPGVGILNFSSMLVDQRGKLKIEMSGMFFMRKNN